MVTDFDAIYVLNVAAGDIKQSFNSIIKVTPQFGRTVAVVKSTFQVNRNKQLWRLAAQKL